MSDMRILGLIPARGGSKGLPGKNVRNLAGRPLIAWTVLAGIESGVLDAVVVSTDDDAIADAAAESGAQVLRRPAELATDTAAMADVVLHALDTLEAQDGDFTHVMLLQPTSPLRGPAEVRQAVDRLRETGGRAVVSVCPAEHSPLLANTLPDDGSMAQFLRPEVSRANRQALAQHYRLNGAVYLAETGFFREHRTFIAEGTFAYVMEAECSVDIDTQLDFRLAELLMSDREARG